MISPEVIVVPAVFGIPAAVLYARMWFRHKERMATLAAQSGTLGGNSALEARLERIEQAVEAMAVELERVGEGQRFMTKVLSERPAGAAALGSGHASVPNNANAGRVNTPH